MTKARTEAEKRRARKSRQAEKNAGMPEIPAIPRKKARGRARMCELAQEGADIETLETRARHAGEPIRTGEARAAQLRDMRAPWRGCEAGRAMAGVVTDDTQRTALWGAICHMRRVQAEYDRAIGAPRRHAQCLRLLAPMDAMQADAASPPVDLRTDAERCRQAVSAWTRVHGWLSCTDGHAASLCKRVVIDDERCSDPAAMVRALHCVVDGLAGRWMVYRRA